MSIEIIIEDARWRSLEIATLAIEAERATFDYFGLDVADFEISALGADDSRLAVLNASFRNKPTATNVLSWPSKVPARRAPGMPPALPQPSDQTELGDIALAYETCRREAQVSQVALKDHVLHLFVHGLLHLLGYDHLNDQDALEMQRTEADILKTLGIANPYGEQIEMIGNMER